MNSLCIVKAGKEAEFDNEDAVERRILCEAAL